MRSKSTTVEIFMTHRSASVEFQVVAVGGTVGQDPLPLTNRSQRHEIYAIFSSSSVSVQNVIKIIHQVF